ncbi:MAG: hypothetical protein B5766_03495 [Candidatus Lumbricidophila eiseniae]|uniref:Uncharacterized protein n=1 Tax=Candidatus Lumbricidiphila eiseniae TaxID=1969409 RepID=A0A2A6FTG6_9MICO|nr:MAG: hypothetical protein B5766_03495 [Candidatus Lumbricidophila eiseniae]
MFKVEAQHVVMFAFTEPRVALLWAHMMVMCREVERVQIEKRVDAGWSVRQIAVVFGSVCAHGVAGDTSGAGGCH